jgi:molecular chaperone GrpE (heat shock protein)
VAAEWLPVVDNLERALEHPDSDSTALISGVRAVPDQALGVLTRLGFPRFEDIGLRFDPTRHEAVTTVESDADSTVGAVWPGYESAEGVLRPAGVGSYVALGLVTDLLDRIDQLEAAVWTGRRGRQRETQKRREVQWT